MSYKKFTYVFIIYLLLLSVFLLSNYTLLQRSGELLDIDEITEHQVKNNSLYASSLYNNHKEHRLSLVTKNNPEIIILGSSRVLDVNSSFFKYKFNNLGQTMASFSDGTKVINYLHANNINPEHLLIGVDFWWFFQDAKIKTQSSTQDNNHFNHLFKPLLWLINGKLGFKQYIGILKDSYKYNFHTFNASRIGISALTKGFSFRKDGSLFDGRVFLQKNINLKFKKHITNPDTHLFFPQERFKRNWEISTYQINEFIKFISTIKSKMPNTNTTLYFPALPPNVYKTMVENKTHDHVINIKDDVYKSTKVSILDLHNSFLYKGMDCEFKDSVHLGNKVYSKLFIHLIEKNSELSKIFDMDYLNYAITQNKYNIFIPQKNEQTSLEEKSLTSISCDQ